MSKSNGISPAGKIGILLTLFGIPCIFIWFSAGFKLLADLAPGIVTVIVVITCDIYAAHVGTLIYRFYESEPPLWRFLPCVGELALMTKKWCRIGIILYIVEILMIAIALAPYGIISVLGDWAIQTLPFYMIFGALIVAAVIQIVKGLGMVEICSDVDEIWFEMTHTSTGAISKAKILMYIPFVRQLGLYSLSKPLETLVTFNQQTYDDANEDTIAEDDVYE